MSTCGLAGASLACLEDTADPLIQAHQPPSCFLLDTSYQNFYQIFPFNWSTILLKNVAFGTYPAAAVSRAAGALCGEVRLYIYITPSISVRRGAPDDRWQPRNTTPPPNARLLSARGRLLAGGGYHPNPNPPASRNR